MFLSIIIPVYNCEKYIDKCLDSILNAQLTDFEMILIDDGSKDSSAKICDEYSRKDDRIKVISKDNEGASAARNLGISLSQGEYITFVDSDDYVIPEEYKKAVDHLKEYRTDILSVNMLRDVNGELSKIPFEDKGITDSVIEYPIYMHHVTNKFFKKNVIIENDIRYDTDLIVYEDFLFVFKAMLSCGKNEFIDNYCYVYRDNPVSVVNYTHDEKKAQDLLSAYERAGEFLDSKGLKDEYSKLLEYLKMKAALRYLLGVESYSPKKYRQINKEKSVWTFTDEKRYKILTSLSNHGIDIFAFIYNRLKRVKTGKKEK